MRILITGASGFIGGHLVNKLLTQSHEIHALTRQETNLGLFGESLDKIACHQHDGSTISILEIIEQTKPDAVIHLASLFIGEHRTEDVQGLISSNILLSTQLVEGMCQNNVRLLINAGTSWQHYQNNEYSPVNLYAATKQAFRSVLKYYVESTDIMVVNLELFDTFGPNDRRGKIFSLFNRAS
ncbi:MAG: NAD-dependent epimerase/dehydratase family protein [SAR202 cluster bacterium]|nr:NAD-dependent epimerase/dehydratase family protein [SAR202 cluster bacterium]